jgi:D-psicose/D-tagatose/L-ribulose 3-epimerase
MLHDMGGKQLSGIIYGMWPGTLDEKYSSKEGAWENSVRSMQEVTPLLEEYDVYFNVEVVNRFEQFLMNTCEEGLQYIEMVGSPNVKMLLDTFHMNIEEDTIASAIVKAGDKLGHLHIGENNRKPPGYGHIPWDELGTALQQINYQGAVVMEPFLMPGGEVGRDIRVFRDVMSSTYDLDEEARKAAEFIRGKLST